MSRRGVSGWMFLLIPAHPGSPGQRIIKRWCVCVCRMNGCIVISVDVLKGLNVLITLPQ